ncbi:hypothetical protein COL68_23660 [Bacillus wiedmannii]|uniref:hypothetical protein n=1 Tax=Bacillus wiedmannii TaxID=1890302 RepID=UPI000BF6E192|nr:hypothetical protein [Bacillus wiedmannii]PFZ53520.1 hypothetical protein COL68_23660 [Bacillus wiedmannii]
MQKINWKKENMRWYNVLEDEVAISLMDAVSHELDFYQIRTIYKEGFGLDIKKGDEFIGLELEDVADIFEDRFQLKFCKVEKTLRY